MTKFKCLYELLEVLPTKQSCIDYFEKLRWPNGVVSPYDPTAKVWKLAKKNQYRCKNTDKDFNVLTGTIFENSNILIRKWFYILGIYSFHVNGISSYQLINHVGITHDSNWFALQRLRHASDLPIFETMMEGDVEIDETFVGGKNKWRHWNKKIFHSQGRSLKDKILLFGMLERNSKRFFAQATLNNKLKTLVPIIKDKVKEGSNINSDEWYRKSKLGERYNHQMVNHKKKEYAKGKGKERISVNAVENRWSRFKPMNNLTYRGVSREHFQKYVNEFVFRDNTRELSFQEKFDLLLSSTIGKRITYQQLIAPTNEKSTLSTHYKSQVIRICWDSYKIEEKYQNFIIKERVDVKIEIEVWQKAWKEWRMAR